MIRIESVVDFAPGALLPVAVGIVDDAIADTVMAVAMLTTLVVAFPAVVVIGFEVNALIVA